MFLKYFLLVVFASIFLLIFDRLYIHNLIVSTFRIEIDSNMTMILVPNHILNNKNFITFPEFSWIIFLTILASSILSSILNLPERLFLIDKTKTKYYSQNKSRQTKSFKTYFFKQSLICLFLFLLINSNKGTHEPKNGFEILTITGKSDFFSMKVFNALQSVAKATIRK